MSVFFLDGVMTALPNPDRTGADTNYDFGVSVNLITNTNGTATYTYSYGYEYKTMSVLLSSGTHTIGFAVYNTGDTSVNTGLFIDNVTLGAVPEPGTAALMGCGLVVLAGAAWRRRSSAA